MMIDFMTKQHHAASRGPPISVQSLPCCLCINAIECISILPPIAVSAGILVKREYKEQEWQHKEQSALRKENGGPMSETLLELYPHLTPFLDEDSRAVVL